MCLHYTMASQAIVLLTITKLPNLCKSADECLDYFIHSPFVKIRTYIFMINVTHFGHAKKLKSLSKVVFVSRPVGAQSSRGELQGGQSKKCYQIPCSCLQLAGTWGSSCASDNRLLFV